MSDSTTDKPFDTAFNHKTTGQCPVNQIDTTANNHNPTDQIIQSQVAAMIEAAMATNQDLIVRLEERLESYEQSLTVMINAYAQLAGMVQALVDRMINSSPEEQAAFYDALKKSQRVILETLTNATRAAERESERFIPYSPSPPEGSSDTANH